ncbi:hypothetical protein [[Mycobacterium] nativiensis]|uniref:YcxB-like protein domain-containing protein n=1 Tax=[Mycobacterium] nativiensis TaxID=2855503 RepID=A0ABU5Y1E0_9MYCO|nr:hypothetical protein [Mycolicibacter sp. MYC340]MEB3034069.1 hypothetical protein [Mycolicibacter sp. MYC340]
MESIAAQEDYGPYRRSYRVNRSHDRRLRSAMVVLLFAPLPFLWMAYRAGPWAGDDTQSSMTGMLASGIPGLIFVGLTLFLAIPGLIRMASAKGAQVHVFERGAIAERPGGDLYAWPYRRATARYVSWRESTDGQWHDHPQLWVTFHRGGETICLDGRAPKDRAVLPDLAREFGISDEPEQVDGVYRNTAPLPF